jgi:hypothetical protein
MRNKTVLAIIGLAAIVLIAIGTSSADVSHDPAMPVVVPYDQEYDFSLWGNRAGSFAYYRFEYPGNGSVITIDLDAAPGDPVALQGVGFNVYGYNGYLIGSGTRDLYIADRKTLEWADQNRGPWLVQVYNYLDGVSVAFHLKVQGLPGLTPTPEPVMVPAQATSFSAVWGTLMGNPAGNYHFYNIDSLGDGTLVTLQLSYAPDDQWISNGFGINVYAPYDGLLVAQGGHEAKFRLDWPGTYLVQVYNYVDGTNVTYWLNRTPS